jgi:hypothetical protein
VTFKTERDVITVGADEGVYKKVKLTVKKSGIHFKERINHVYFKALQTFDNLLYAFSATSVFTDRS